MAKLAILGFGTVGSGVLEILHRNGAGITRRLGQSLSVKYICDIRTFSGYPPEIQFVDKLDPILADDEVQVVVETIGGATIAYEYVQRALKSGRHVVTSNKELVATHGAGLLALARENGVCFLFEASVGGGTPIITPMYQSLVANRITSVSGIVNGTTNFMLTRMGRAGLDFGAALAEAQALGYAETIDPSSDVDGIDACRKIAILASLATGGHVYPQNVPTRGIRGITPGDMAAAQKLGRAVKLIAWAKKDEDAPLGIGVEPMMVPATSQLAGVEDVYNAVAIEGDMLGEVVFYGQGAGKLPTASAVVADAIAALKEGVKIHDSLFWKPAEPIEGTYPDAEPHDYYLRFEGAVPTEGLRGATALGGGAVVLNGVSPAQLAQEMRTWQRAGAPVALVLRLWA
ncbi:MAG: homoserine dehydrogenase [Oscillospiraceae bacterium]